jgi:hypothetical protein
MGVQGLVPRPRFNAPGVGRIESVSPRVHMNGPGAGGLVHYFTAAEWDYDRIPVPDVTQGSGPDVVEQTVTVFGRVDAQVTPRQTFTLEGVAFPSSTHAWGLSTQREEASTADVTSHDWFGGFTDRLIVSDTSTLTIRVSAFARDSRLTPHGSGESLLSPAGWRGNWFATGERNAVRYAAAVTWERIVSLHTGVHDLSVSSEISSRALKGTLLETPITIENGDGQVVRRLDFGPFAVMEARDRPLAISARDLWQVSQRLQLDGGVRLDYTSYTGGAPSGRLGARFTLDQSGATVLKAGFGTFVGSLPLNVPAFAGRPERRIIDFDPATGTLASETFLRPTVGDLRLPQAFTTTVALERQLLPGLDAQVVITRRNSSRLATLSVPLESGPLTVRSSGTAQYREVQFAIRRSWQHDQQLFVSYVRSSARGELNDFAALFQMFDAPLVQPGGMSRLPSDARHRILVWSTFDLPSRIVVSPVVEWRTGFPFSALNERYFYEGKPNDRTFPDFMSTDLVLYKTFTVRRRSADLGVQVFNLLNHRNPRDVFSVTGAPRFGQFANSVGRIFRGYMLVKWG